VNQLPSVPQSQVHCEEPLGLTYRIDFGPGSVARSKAVADGYRCDAAVTVTVAGKAKSWRRGPLSAVHHVILLASDANCALLGAVRRALPGRAKATQSLDVRCAS